MTIIVNKVSQKTITVDDCPRDSIIFEQSQRGPRGPRGLSDLFFLTREAAADLGGHRAVISREDGTIEYADSSNLNHLGKVLGVIVQAVLTGESVNVIRGGLLEFEGWDWNVNLPVYLAENGLLTQNPVSAGFSQIVGFAESPTGLFVNLREPIQLEV